MNTSIKKELETPNPSDFSVSSRKYAALACFCLGLFLLISGIILSAFAFFEKTNFDKTEIFLFITSFVFFGVGAHCLDLLEDIKKAKNKSL